MLTLCSFVLNGFDLNCSVTPQAQYSPLLLAAGRKDAPDPEMIQILLTAGADINFKCMYHTTALHEAVERGHTRVMQKTFHLRSDNAY